MFSGIGIEQPITLTLYTDAFVIRGMIRTRQRRVTDILNQRDESFLVLEDVTIDEFGSRGVASRAEYAQVNLESVLFAIADDAVEPLPELRTPKVPEQALVSVPPFKIVGTIHLQPSETGLRAALGELEGRFLPCTHAMFWSDAIGEARTQSMLVAFNHSRAQILAPHREVDPWEGMPRPESTSPAAPDGPAGGW